MRTSTSDTTQILGAAATVWALPGILDGSQAGASSTLYTHPFDLPKDRVLKMRTFRPNGRGSRTITGTGPVRRGP